MASQGIDPQAGAGVLSGVNRGEPQPFCASRTSSRHPRTSNHVAPGSRRQLRVTSPSPLKPSTERPPALPEGSRNGCRCRFRAVIRPSLKTLSDRPGTCQTIAGKGLTRTRDEPRNLFPVPALSPPTSSPTRPEVRNPLSANGLYRSGRPVHDSHTGWARFSTAKTEFSTGYPRVIHTVCSGRRGRGPARLSTRDSRRTLRAWNARPCGG